MAAPTLIYCAGGNRRFAELATGAGFVYGARLPDTTYFPLWFADQDWKKPNRALYVEYLRRERPTQATVLDLEREGQLAEVLDWAEEVSQYVARVVIVPKCFGIIERLPRRIGGADVVLGYSVPTKYAGTEVPTWEFAGWPVHLLGGSPHGQMRLMYSLDVVSADGNMTNRMAMWNRFWVNGTSRNSSNRDRYWPSLDDADGVKWGVDAPYEAFRRSCINVWAAWHNLF